MNVKEIVKQYLEQNGYDGLAGDDCGCLIDELFICDSCPDECVAGHRVDYGSPECPGENSEKCEWGGECKGLGSGIGYCIRPGKAGE